MQLVGWGGAVVRAAGLVGGGETVSAGLADRFSSAFVFVVGCDVADGLVETDWSAPRNPDSGS